jgi:uncharacterized protein (DUF1330 family)
MARAKIIDPAVYKEYREATKISSRNHPRRVLARGGRFEVLEGQTTYDRFVILEYPSFDAALEYYHSPEYQAAAVIRRHASNNEVVVLEGLAEDSKET